MTHQHDRQAASEPSSTHAKTPAHVYAAQRDWPAYFDVVQGKPPRETLLRALDAFDNEGLCAVVGEQKVDEAHRPCAIDLGCGEGRDTVELLRRGWKVQAIDGHPDAIARLESRDDLQPDWRERLDIRYGPFEGLALPNVTFINASFCLPFCHPDHFDSLWNTIVAAIRPGGRFAGQLFGDRDDWASIADRSHHTIAQARALFGDFDLEYFEEIEDDGKDAMENPKHWHRFDIVARKR